jgi:hypothetical protein
MKQTRTTTYGRRMQANRGLSPELFSESSVLSAALGYYQQTRGRRREPAGLLAYWLSKGAISVPGLASYCTGRLKNYFLN